MPRSRRVEVFERLNERGEVLIPFDEVSLKIAIEQMQAANVEAVAICLLFSFANPDHERKVAEASRAAGFYVSVSSEVLPEFREYERTSTVVLNAYVGPLIDRYLKGLEDSLERIDMRSASYAEGSYALLYVPQPVCQQLLPSSCSVHFFCRGHSGRMPIYRACQANPTVSAAPDRARA